MRRAMLFQGDVPRRAGEILQAGAICDECLGRAFGRVGTGLTNTERGRCLRTMLCMLGTEGTDGRCWVCDGAFLRVDEWACRAEELARGLEFDTYLFGVQVSARLKATEAFFLERFPTGEAEPMKHAFNRAVGKAFEALIRRGTVDFASPDLLFQIDLERDSIALRNASLYLYGRYRKLARGIPQTRWPCRRCRGRGCEECGFTGKQYPESVEELIARPLVESSGADDGRLHGAGREDIDARMLGDGRPFVLELVSPKRRSLGLERLEQEVNEEAAGKVEISRLRVTERATVAAIKEARATKRYRAIVEFGQPVTERELLGALRCLVGDVDQRTPRRVAHRRSDRIRRRGLFAAEGRFVDSGRAQVEFLADGGLYVKELVSGDEGRTVPSLSERLGVEAWVVELDVVEVSSSAFPDEGGGGLDNGEALP